MQRAEMRMDSQGRIIGGAICGTGMVRAMEM